MIKNKINGKVYIGSSGNIKERWSQHRTTLNKKIHINSYFQRAWNKYKEESFEFIILEKTKRERKIIIETEQKYIDFYESYKSKNGYNINSKADSSLGRKISKKSRKKSSERLKKKWKENRDEMIESLKKRNQSEWKENISKTRIEKGLSKGEKNNMYGKGCYKVWVDKYGKEVADEMWKEVAKKNSIANSKEKNAMWGKKREKVGELNSLLKSKPILQFDLNGKFLKEYASISEASRDLKSKIDAFRYNSDGRACGFIWKYKKNKNGKSKK